MRIVGEMSQAGFKISLFRTEERFLLKFEDNTGEISFKIKPSEGLETPSDILSRVDGMLLDQVREQFEGLRRAQRAFLPVAETPRQELDFPEII